VRIEPYLLSLAGEYRVCSELCKRGVLATVTYGNRKSVDVYVISDRQERALKIEVKTSQLGRFVTGITQKGLAEDSTAPDFWVLFDLRGGPDGTFSERFFVLRHSEMCRIQASINRRHNDRYKAKHGHSYDVSRGVDNVSVNDVQQHEGQWSKDPCPFPTEWRTLKRVSRECQPDVRRCSLIAIR